MSLLSKLFLFRIFLLRVSFSYFQCCINLLMVSHTPNEIIFWRWISWAPDLCHTSAYLLFQYADAPIFPYSVFRVLLSFLPTPSLDFPVLFCNSYKLHYSTIDDCSRFIISFFLRSFTIALFRYLPPYLPCPTLSSPLLPHRILFCSSYLTSSYLISSYLILSQPRLSYLTLIFLLSTFLLLDTLLNLF